MGISKNYDLPSGAVMYFAGIHPPVGWLKANGAAVLKSEYPDLFRAISNIYGYPNPNTGLTFLLPDLRGEFIRGVDDGRGVDTFISISGVTSRLIGTTQNDQMQGHKHLSSGSASLTGGLGSLPLISGTSGGATAQSNLLVGLPQDDGANGVPRTGTETRPRNVALMACIKT